MPQPLYVFPLEHTLNRYQWSRLNHLQVGRYAEYFTKMEFTLFGYEVYTSEVDDRGIDFVVRGTSGNYYEVQVKSLRGSGYIFIQKDRFILSPNRLAAVVIFMNGQSPFLYLIPASAWRAPNELLVSHDYKGKKSNPEWGLNVSAKNMKLLEAYEFEKIIQTL